MNRPKSRTARALILPAALALAGGAALALPRTPGVPGRTPHGPAAQAGEENRFTVVPLVSDGSVAAPNADPALVNPWGLARGPAGPWWIADNGADRATLYDGDGAANPLVVAFPAGAAPTGVAFNGGESFVVSDGVNSGPALFLFAGEDGRVYGWNPAVPPPVPSPDAFLVHDDTGSDAIFKGIALAATGAGDRLYLTDFHNRRVEVLDGSFQPVALPESAFVDTRVPKEFAPFGIQNILGRIVVTYAKRDAGGEDDVAGQGLGYVDAYDTDGRLLGRLATRGLLNSPWGLALAPQGFGRFGGDLLVGNFGDGRIVAFHLSDDFRRATPAGLLLDAAQRPIAIEGLWSIGFGNNLGAGPSDTLFFTAGPGDEEHGLFGSIEAH